MRPIKRLLRQLGILVFTMLQDAWDLWMVPPIAAGDPPRRRRVRCPPFTLWRRTRIMRAAARLIRHTGKDVCFNFPGRTNMEEAGHGTGRPEAAPPVDDGVFRIHVWSAARDSGFTEAPAQLFNHRVQTRGEAFIGSSLGLPIYSSEGWMVAELVGDNLYLHCDIGTNAESDDSAVIAEILARAEKLLALPSEERMRHLARARELAREQAQRNFLRLAAGDSMAALEAAENGARTAVSAEAQAREAFIEAQRALSQTSRIHAVDQARLSQERERFSAEFDEIRQMPQVEEVRVGRSSMEVFTKTLTCTHPQTGREHEIGRFRIVVYFDGRNGGVRWFNLNAPKEIGGQRMQGPLIREDGSAWALSMTEVFTDFLIERSFHIVVSLAIQFVESPDPEALGVRWINRWPAAARKETEDEISVD